VKDEGGKQREREGEERLGKKGKKRGKGGFR
jgi:hypothetical protein